MTKSEQYIEYINEHQGNVKKAWGNVQLKLDGEYFLDDFTWHGINELVKIHDQSKFSPVEFEGYRQFFYHKECESKDKDLFLVSWLHHKNANPHHWNYWILDTKPLPMPFPYILEMLLDWTAMSYNFNDCPLKYWEKNQSKMILHEETVVIVERWIKLFKKDSR